MKDWVVMFFYFGQYILPVPALPFNIVQQLDPFQVFKWTGDNMFFIKGDMDSLAVGGGGCVK